MPDNLEKLDSFLEETSKIRRSKLGKKNKDREIIKLAEAGANDAHLILFDNIEELRDAMSEIEEDVGNLEDSVKSLQRNLVKEIKEGGKIGNAIKSEDIERMVMKLALKLIDIHKGDDGHTPTREELLALITPLIPPIPTVVQGEKGDEGKTPVFGKDYFTKTHTLELIEKVLERIPLPETLTGNELIETINKGEKKIDRERIEGLDDFVKKSAQGLPVLGGVSGRDIFTDIDISADLDGTKKTFDIQATYNIISVHLSSFPYAIRKTIDFTYTMTSITFTGEIDAPTALAKGTTCIITAVIA